MNQTIVTFEAKDLKSDNSALPGNLHLPDNSSLSGGLCKTLQLCVGAKVMVIKNVDVSDGQVNGTQGIIRDFWKPETAEKKVITAVKVKLDDNNSKAQTRAKYPQIGRKYPGCIPIFKDEVTLHIGGYITGCQVVRQQFPLRLSWACTVHKNAGYDTTESCGTR